VTEPNIGREDFVELTEDGDLIPIRFEVETELSPLEAYAGASRDSEYSVLLESGDHSESDEMDNRGRYSFIGVDPAAIFRGGDGEAEIEPLRTEDHGLGFDETLEDGDIVEGYDVLDALRDARPDKDPDRLAQNEGKYPLEAGFVGFHPYEMVYDTQPIDLDGEIPKSEFIYADRIIAYDHVEDEVELIFTPREDAPAGELYDNILEEAEEYIDVLESEVELPSGIEVQSVESGSKEDYEDMVREVKDHVVKGDTYQTVVSRKKIIDAKGSPLSVYEDLRERNPSPYMYFIDFGGEGIMGASPETLSRTEGDKVVTNPIAGTTKRGETPVEDRKLAGEMLSDEKELSEHVMLVDLGRNDIAEVSKEGTMEVEDFMDVVEYSTVQHIESTVSGTLEEDLDEFDAMRSIFPAGTLTGAPKVRSMEIIDELEDEPRLVYGGGVGFYADQGVSDSAITIRSAHFEENEDSFDSVVQAGAGIVADSEAESEYDETNDKMGSILESFRAVDRGDGL
jgi:anthranilate synthase component 1